MERTYEVGAAVKYVDEHGSAHDALVTIWWGSPAHPQYQSEWGDPGCNLVYVTGDASRDDPYGRQIERRTSVVHKRKQVAPGNYWVFSDEM
jgi:hypothetical protein